MKTIRPYFAALFACTILLFSHSVATWAAEGADSHAKVLESLPQSKLTLSQGIQQAAAKAPEAAISAKFEIHDGALALSVYTAEKGLNGDAEHNVLKELIGSPAGEKWTPEVEVFKDVPHVSRSAQQLALMSLTKLTLVDVIKKAEQDQPGKVFSIAPAIRDGKPIFVLLVAQGSKATEMQYDLMTGNKAGAR
jgi:hypothetical protein